MKRCFPSPIALFVGVLLLIVNSVSASAAQTVRTQLPVYGPNETITVWFEGLPGNDQDWITLVPAGTPDTEYGQYFFTAGKREGTLNFNGKPAGAYEIRVFHNWPAGGYVVQDRQPVLVQPVAGGGIAWTHKPVYAAQEPILVEFSRLPGNAQDWITLVAAAQPDNQYGEYFFTQGKSAGQMNFNGLPPGSYEVRLYYNWPSDGFKVQFRYPFVVR